MDRRDFALGGAWTVVLWTSLERASATPIVTTRENQDQDFLDINKFMEISHYLTGNPNLNVNVGEKIRQHLQSLPLHRKNLLQISRLKKQGSLATFRSPTHFAARHKDLQVTIQELLAAWYIGYSNDDKKPVLFTYYDAIMYQTMTGVLNIPGTCGGAYHFWSEPPDV